MAGAPEQRSESILEITHRLQLRPSFYLQPNVQYIINPGAANQYGNALVVGAQVGVTF